MTIVPLKSVKRLLVQPEDGVKPVIDLFDQAMHSLRIKMFSFTDERLLQALERPLSRGVKVQVLLNRADAVGIHYNDDTARRFEAIGVTWNWSSEAFAVTHEKTVVADETTALISTFNFTPKNLGITRDYGVIVEDADVVAEIVACFEADWERRDFTPSPSGSLAWSNCNARPRTMSFIDQASKSLDIEHTKLLDMVTLDRLTEAAERGVKVRFLSGGANILKPHDRDGILAGYRIVRRSGIALHRPPKHMKLHAKLIIADGQSALLGSTNLHQTAFETRRELSVAIADPRAIARLHHTFEADWVASRHFHPADPVDAGAVADDEAPPEHDDRHHD